MTAVIASTARPLAIIRSYAELHAALRQRADQLNVSRLVLDEVSGLPGGYCSKLLSPNRTKKLGALSMQLLLGALGVKLAVLEDAEQLARIRPKLVQRGAVPGTLHWRQKRAAADDAKRVSRSAEARALKNALRRNGRKGARARMEKLSPEQRSQIASGAARARWAQAAESR